MTKTKTMMKGMIALWVLAALAGTAFAQSDSQPPAPAAPDAASTPPPAAPSSADARKACSAAMNADPAFAAEIIRVADERAQAKRDADTVAAHVDANLHVQKNERHVIYAYAVIWIIAAGFVIFLWRRQQVLQAEIGNLRRDLEAAADEATASKRGT
jgi:CcmD family protein